MKNYYYSKTSVFILAWCLLFSLSEAKSIILGYQPIFITGFDESGNLQIAIRSYYKKAGNDYNLLFLSVNPFTLTTSEILASKFKARPKSLGKSGYYTFRQIKNTPYYRALIKYTSPPYKLQNYGIKQSENKAGHFLTIDMCPSSKPFEKKFFNALAKLKNAHNKPTNIAISISGIFLITHKDEFDQLASLHRENKLNITWINHSFSHIYYADLSLESNFLLFLHTSQDWEILQTEQLLLEDGQLPSPFFRFPGLVSNKQLVLKLRKLSLIPIGSNAWLAKGEQITHGSIILVHGNSNEPKGIELIMPKLSTLNLQPLQKLFSR